MREYKLFLSVTWICFFVTIINVASMCLAMGSIEGLYEISIRKYRYSTAKWGPEKLENSSNPFIWQPETLSYFDSLTGKEVWILTHAPDKSEYTSKEHGVNAWSFDGSRVGFFSLTRLSNNPTLKADYHFRWIVNTDGSGLRMCEGYGRRSIPLDGFGWAHTENAYYTPGSGAGDATTDSTPSKMYRNVVDHNNSVSGNLVFDTSSINTFNKDLVKDGVAQDDKMIVLRDTVTHDAGPPNVTATTEMYFIDLKSNPATVAHWGIARGIGPAADPYGTHTSSDELRWHDVWAPGPSPKWIMGDYTGNSDIFVTMDRNGMASDGGPKWTDWDRSKFGEIRVESNGTGGIPKNPYNMPYFGHPAFDRWGRYALVGTYTDPQSSAGTRIWDSKTHSLLPNFMMKGKYDGQHHSWTGWTDHIVMVDPVNHIIYGNKYKGNETTRYPIVDTHYPGNSGNYMGYPRPSQSPDGTKVAFHMLWLNNKGDSYPNIAWAVAYYPYPPSNLKAIKTSSGIRLSWERPAYTSRGWPDENHDPPPKSREIKGYHVWVSDNGKTGWSEITTNASSGETYDLPQEWNSIKYYAVTSEEFSRLESRKLSEILKVSVDTFGTVSCVKYLDEVISKFWTNKPNFPIPSVFHVEAGGNYALSWQEPADSKIRYYNVYYSSAGPPTVSQGYRIASLPVGTKSYFDWNADTSKQGYYKITSVDRYGNESD